MKSIEMQHIAGLSPSSPLPMSSVSSGSSASSATSSVVSSTLTTSAVAPAANAAATSSSSSQHFCLRWNNYQTNLTQVFDQLLQNESFVDVTLVCENHSIKAHKMVLSACSPYFQSLFYDNPCQHPIIIFTDVKWPEMKAIVDFMYRGEINVSHDQISPLLKVAEILKIRGLTDVNSNDKDLYFESATGGRRSGEISVDVTKEGPESVGRGRKRFRGSGSPKASEYEQVRPEPVSVAVSALDCTTNGQLVDDFVPGVEDLVAEPVSTAARLDIKPELDELETGAVLNDDINDCDDDDDDNDDADDDDDDNNDIDGDDNLMAVDDCGPDTAKQPPKAPLVALDDTEIKPGIAEMIREEERAKMLESSHGWLGAAAAAAASSSSTSQSQSTSSSVADNLKDETSQNDKRPERNSNGNGGAVTKTKVPSWTQHELNQAIEAVIKQKMRFTQASARYKIPKGTLYDNILGKTNRMIILDEIGLTVAEELAVIQYCCNLSASPYNRKTNLSLANILAFVRSLIGLRLPHFQQQQHYLDELTGYRWWWAFCKRHNINSLYYENNKRCLFLNQQNGGATSGSGSGGGGSSSSGGDVEKKPLSSYNLNVLNFKGLV